MSEERPRKYQKVTCGDYVAMKMTPGQRKIVMEGCV